MNIKVRMKNWSFWVSIVLSVATPILAYFGLTAADMTTWPTLGKVLWDAAQNPYVVGLVLVSVYNALIDPTTAGIKDSVRAMGYKVPGGNDEQ